ncbi:MAG: lipopolysaccharide biosynthesis protein [Treponema sp.]|nr:lipopolysaccharide biosynthesis protein [Treponema sp.]
MNDIKTEEKNNTNVVNQTFQDDEISLIDLFAVLLKYKKMIITLTILGMIFILGYSILSLVLPPEKSFLPNKYTPKAQMLINDEQPSSGGLVATLNNSGLRSLAGITGINSSSSHSALAEYLVSSNTLLDNVVQEFDLINKFKIKKFPKTTSRNKLRKILVSNFDDKSGVFTISFTDIDPEFAREVVNFVVNQLEQRFLEIGVDKNKLAKVNLEENIQNSYEEMIKLQKQIQQLEHSVSNVYANNVPSIMLDTMMIKSELKVQEELYAQLKAQYEMLKIKMASEQPVFQILEYAEIPDMKSKPSRGLICIAFSVAVFIISIFLAFLRNAIKNIKSDPETMAKLKGKN